MSHGIRADAAQILTATVSPEARDAFVAALQRRAAELIHEAGDDEGERTSLRRYLAAVRAAS